MQVGRVSAGAAGRLYGTSFLWHDPDYALDRANPYFRVQKAIDTTLPYQDHVEPERAQDPYLAQEKGYDVAFSQMTRGIEGRDFLHGVKNPDAFASALQTQAVLQSQRGQQNVAPDAAIAERANLERTQTYVAPPPEVKPKGAAATAGDAEKDKAAQAASQHNQVTEVLSMMGGAISTAATAAVQGKSLELLGTQAAKAAGAIQGVATTAASAAGQAVSAHDQHVAEQQAQAGRLARAFSQRAEDAELAEQGRTQAVAAVDPGNEPGKE